MVQYRRSQAASGMTAVYEGKKRKSRRKNDRSFMHACATGCPAISINLYLNS